MSFLNIDFKSKPELLKNLMSLFSDCSIMKFPQIIVLLCVGPKLGEGRRHAQGTYHLIVKTVISRHPSCSPESLICRKYMSERSPRKQSNRLLNLRPGTHQMKQSAELFTFGYIVANEPLISPQQWHLWGRAREAIWRIKSTVFGFLKEANIFWIPYCWDTILHETFHTSVPPGPPKQRGLANLVKE